MEELDEKIEEVTKVLFDKFPKYFFELDPNLPYDEYNLKYKGYLCPHSFKNSFGQKVDELIFLLKKQKNSNNVTNKDIQLIIDELSKAIETFKLLKLRDKEFQFQSEATICIYDGLMNYSKIEEIDEDFFNRIVLTSQSKYDHTIRLIKGLKEILENDKQIETKDKEPNVDEFFDLILDHVPRFVNSDHDDYDSAGNYQLTFVVDYKGFTQPTDYYIATFENARKILNRFRKEHAIGKLNDEYIDGYLKELYFEKGNFVIKPINEKDYLCHCNTNYNPNLGIGDKLYAIEEVKDGWAVEAILKYNEYRYGIIEYMIDGIEKITNKKTEKQDELERLELQVPVADLVLLFRLLKENNVFKAKYNTHIYRIIQNSFNVPGKDNFNEGSIKNAFNSPDPNSVKNLEFLLANMKTSLKKI